MNEIERKFLLKNEQFTPTSAGIRIRQGYLTFDAERVVRVRIADENGFITIKGKMEGITRPEFEYEIPKNEAELMLKMCLNDIVEKIRYKEIYNGMLWEVDIFKNENEGLSIAEIELASEDQFFEIPFWVGEEVTFDKRYYNSWLSRNPFKKWQNS